MRNNKSYAAWKCRGDDWRIKSTKGEYLAFVASAGDGGENIDVRYQDENIWLTQKMLATLYNVKVNTINYHIQKIFEDSELESDSVIRKFRITASDGKPYEVLHYFCNSQSICRN